jgi:hypothetical protein
MDKAINVDHALTQNRQRCTILPRSTISHDQCALDPHLSSTANLDITVKMDDLTFPDDEIIDFDDQNFACRIS